MSAEAPGGPSGFRAGAVALLGWTNVGKSTLLNRLLGQKLAAVSSTAQTTRHQIRGVHHVAGRGQIVLLDTPGLHQPRHRMNRTMLEETRRTLAEVDLTLLVVDAARGPGPGDRRAADWLRSKEAPGLAVLNKIDLLREKSRLLPMMRTLVEEWGMREALPISARTGAGCDELVERILAWLPEGPGLHESDFLTDQPERAIAAEWIREKLLELTRQELPHATAVLVDRWHERADGLVEIAASVLVERESQKQIVVGKGGALLKQVGTRARIELEQFLDRRVFLELWVRTRKDWRDDEQVLRLLGLGG